MICAWRITAVAALALLPLCGGLGRAHAQFVRMALPNSRFELTDTVQLDRADNAVLAQLQRVKAFLADRQWDEAIETLRQLMESAEGKLLGATERRFVSLREYCQLQLASMPAEGLALYRSRVDPSARKWYDDAVQRRDRAGLTKIVDQALASSWGDKALLALGELALESGDYAAARWYWERIIPARPPAGVPNTWPGYPDTKLDLATVRARLVLVSILEGSFDRAREELAQFTQLHPQAHGRLGGREVNYAEALASLVAEGASWPQPAPSPDWPTFAGNFIRNRRVAHKIDVGRVAWRVPLPAVETRAVGAAAPRASLGYHPVVIGELLLVNTPREILALRAATGKPAWGQSGAAIYRDPFPEPPSVALAPPTTLGAPRFTMTALDGRLYARVGGQITAGQEPAALGGGHLLCLDLAAQGRLLWKTAAEEGWTLEGSPVVDATGVYLAMRRHDIRPQAYVACFDVQTGRLRWRQFVCAAETPTRGVLPQVTQNLLSMAGRTLYCNTNLGAVAALAVEDGQVRWLSLYPRALRGDLAKLAPHWHRDLNPCLVDRGTLLVAPTDSPRIFAFDAANGQMLWQTGEEVADVTHLLGTTPEHLVAAGQKLYWIGLKEDDRGRVKHVWPEGAERPGHGRGLIVADGVLWPTREKIYLFDQKTARPKKVFDLNARGASGGNLVVAGGRLLVATATELIALDRSGGKSTEAPGETVANVTAPGEPDR